jgi:thioredoxin 1
MIKHATIEDFDTLTNEGLVLVDFWAPWCGPCKMISPILDELAIELQGKVEIVKVNVDENGEIAGKFGIMSIPTLLVFKDGEKVDTIIGFQPKDALKAKIEAHM